MSHHGRIMKKSLLAAVALIAFGLVFAAGTWVGWRSASTARAPRQDAILYYACPMHPQYHADKPGDCPSCGMRLEPVRADARTVASRRRRAGLRNADRLARQAAADRRPHRGGAALAGDPDDPDGRPRGGGRGPRLPARRHGRRRRTRSPAQFRRAVRRAGRGPAHVLQPGVPRAPSRRSTTP